MSADELLSSLAVTMGLSNARFDDNRACRLKFDGRLEIDIEAPDDAGVLNLFGVIGILPAQSPAEFYESLLEANLPAEAEAGPAIALDSSTRELLLTQSFRVEHLTVDQLVQALERLLSELEEWQERLAASGQNQAIISDGDGDGETTGAPMMAV